MPEQALPARLVRSIVKRSAVVPIVVQIAERMGAAVLIEPEYGFAGHITFANGKTSFFRDAKLSINPHGSAIIAQDKGYAAFFLQQFGFPVPEGQTFFSEGLCRRVATPRSLDDAAAYAAQLGYPLIIKPNSSSKGRGVTKVANEAELREAGQAILVGSDVLLVQRWYAGEDYRIVVFDDQIIAAYRRLPLRITGDGSATVEQLLLARQQAMELRGSTDLIDLADPRIAMRLMQEQLTFECVLELGRSVQLLDNANLSTGGSAVDLTDRLHPDWCAVARAITRAMGLRLCGVDIITADLAGPLTDYVVVEINSSPGLEHYAALGPQQAARVEAMYVRILAELERGACEACHE